MNIRTVITLALFVGIGAVLHTVVPPILFGMKPDMLLSMMFLGILFVPQPKYVIILSITTGIVSALTTGVPGGQIANIIDKPITAFLFLGLFLLMRDNIHGNIVAPLLTGIGTMISGTIFLTVALYIIGLMNGSFIPLFVGIVLPAAAVNTLVMVILYPIVQGIIKRTKPLTT
ncbi:MAG TPA: tryptophan transporter [Bacillota bacterium]